MSERDRRPVVLATVPHYLPGFKGGGKLIALRNLIAALEDQFRFKVMTTDRDLGDANPYSGIAPNRWLRNEDCAVFYRNSRERICAVLGRTDYSLLYLNTLFSRPFGITPLWLRRFGRLPRRPTIVAPRGELSLAALAIKPRRKKSFLAIARLLRLGDGVIWQASAQQEADDIRRNFGARCNVVVASDPLSAEYRDWKTTAHGKRRGHLKIVFLSRIAPIKNLHRALEATRGLSGDIRFQIYGPVDDTSYWARCQKLITTLPGNIHTEYRGSLASTEVSNAFRGQDLFMLPSGGESFGFVILEALLAGCPVLVSDQTRWRNLAEKGVGWDLPLDRLDLFRAALAESVAMDNAAHQAMSSRARDLALDYIAHDESVDRNAVMFHRALAAAGSSSPTN